MNGRAVIFDAPGKLDLRSVALKPLSTGEVCAEIHYSGISTGTEKLLWTGRMPSFPGMGYPLVPGYESVGRIVDAAPDCRARIGEWVFVPGANCYTDVRGLFGGAGRTLIVPSARAVPVAEHLAERGVLYALAATALHAIGKGGLPQLIVGHGVLGRLIARLTLAAGGPPPTVWEIDPARGSGAQGYSVLHPDDDDRHDYQHIFDVSGDAGLVDPLIGRLAKGGELVLAGFYGAPISFAFPAAFQREVRLRVAAEWQADDLASIHALVMAGDLSLDGLISDMAPVTDAARAYPQAFADPACLKMLLDWRECA
jgi:3-hydroxyethyl bacteriochlorophyllide a dehydrogenase